MLYFGAGYNVYALHLPTRDLQLIFTTPDVLVEQPLVSDNVLYFGGPGHMSAKGEMRGEPGFFAFDLRTRHVVWRIPLAAEDYGTYGTYPVLAGDRLLVCARRRLYCLDRKTGAILWEVNNWMGQDGDAVSIPYVSRNRVYYKINEDQSDSGSDGDWAEVNLATGARIGVIPVAVGDRSYNSRYGHGIGVLTDGVIYAATRVNRFGALNIESKQMFWEVEGDNLFQPGLNENTVFTSAGDSLIALHRRTGELVWRYEFGDSVPADWQVHRIFLATRVRPRFAATNDMVIAQGASQMVALDARNGRVLWAKNGH